MISCDITGFTEDKFILSQYYNTTMESIKSEMWLRSSFFSGKSSPLNFKCSASRIKQ